MRTNKISKEVRPRHSVQGRGGADSLLAMKPQEVQERLKLDQLKDKIWYVVPSCATTGEGLFEGLVITATSLPLPIVADNGLGLAIKQC